MKNLITLLVICFSFTCLPSSSYADSITNEELATLLQFAVESNDKQLLKDVIDALVDVKRDGSHDVLLALSKYHNGGKLDFALHNAIKANDLVSACILTYYSKDINKRTEYETVWTQVHGTGKSGCSREGKSPLELAFWQNMKPLMPFLISRGADIYQMRQIGFVFESEEELNFIKEIFPDATMYKKFCITTQKVILASSYQFHRNLIGDAIATNRLDIIEMLGTKSVDWNRPCLEFRNNKITYTPLQYALVMKRDNIALYFITHGAHIK